MTQRRAAITVYAAGLIQGIGLVTFPAASAIFTSPVWFGLSTTAYGLMVVPQVVLAIAALLAGAACPALKELRGVALRPVTNAARLQVHSTARGMRRLGSFTDRIDCASTSTTAGRSKVWRQASRSPTA